MTEKHCQGYLGILGIKTMSVKHLLGLELENIHFQSDIRVTLPHDVTRTPLYRAVPL